MDLKIQKVAPVPAVAVAVPAAVMLWTLGEVRNARVGGAIGKQEDLDLRVLRWQGWGR